MRVTFVCLGALLLFALSAVAGLPGLVNYQGKLVDAAELPVNGSVTMVFSIYDDSTAVTAIWTETHPSIVVSNGLFSVLLGSVTPFTDTVFAGADRFLGVRVEGDPEMRPRTRLVSVPYAQRVNSIQGASGGSLSGQFTVTPDEGEGEGQMYHVGAPMAEIGAGVTMAPPGARSGSVHLLDGAGATSIDLDGQDTTLGVGVATPQANLHVEGDIYVAGGNGDLTHDGNLNLSDITAMSAYVLVRGTFLTPSDLAEGDIDGDGRITLDDIAILTDIVYFSKNKQEAIRRVHGIYGAVIHSNNEDMFFSRGSVGIGTPNPVERLQVVWDTGVDAELGRGVTDVNISYLALRNTNGVKCYIYPDAAGTGLVVTTTKP